MPEPELHAPVPLCTPDGRLHPDAVGWSRRPVHDCRLPRSWGRRKRWDYWCVTSPTAVLSLTFADVDYLGLADVWFLDLDSKRSWNRSVVGLLGQGFDLPHQVGGGSMRAQQRGLRLGITEVDDGTRLTATSDDGSFQADVLVTRPAEHETMSVVIPWSDRRFQCTTKENTRPATGTVSWDRRTWTFSDGKRGAASTTAGANGRTSLRGTGDRPAAEATGGWSVCSSVASGRSAPA